MTERLIKAFDERCTEPLHSNQLPKEVDLKVDYRMWTNLYTIAAMASIGLSEDLRFLDQGSDLVKSESRDGAIKQVSFRNASLLLIGLPTIWSGLMTGTRPWLESVKRSPRCTAGCGS